MFTTPTERGGGEDGEGEDENIDDGCKAILFILIKSNPYTMDSEIG